MKLLKLPVMILLLPFIVIGTFLFVLVICYSIMSINSKTLSNV